MLLNHRIDIFPSFSLAVLLTLLYSGTIIVLFSVSLTHGLTLLLLVACISHFIFVLRQQALRSSPRSIIQIWKKQDNYWQLKDRQHHVEEAILISDSVRTNKIIVLHFKLARYSQQIFIILLPDAMTKENFRQLSVLLKFNH